MHHDLLTVLNSSTLSADVGPGRQSLSMNNVTLYSIMYLKRGSGSRWPPKRCNDFQNFLRDSFTCSAGSWPWPCERRSTLVFVVVPWNLIPTVQVDSFRGTR